MHDLGCELPRIYLPRTPVNRGSRDSGPGARLSPLVSQLVAPAVLDLALGFRAELGDHGLGALAVAQRLVAVAGAPRVRDAPPDRPSATRFSREHPSHGKPPFVRSVAVASPAVASRLALPPPFSLTPSHRTLVVAGISGLQGGRIALG
jgi:hypothetical protein